jgi:hypothetical protein
MSACYFAIGKRPNFFYHESGRFPCSKSWGLQDFSISELEQLVAGSRITSFEANEAIAHHDAEAARFSVILSGEAALPIGEVSTGIIAATKIYKIQSGAHDRT